VTTGLRALPLAPPPVHGETIGSYLNRLADANHLTIGHFSSLIGPSRQHRRDDNRVGYWTPVGVLRLAALTSRSPSSLIHAMPPLGTIGDPIRRFAAVRHRGSHRAAASPGLSPLHGSPPHPRSCCPQHSSP
jgi:TniQ protein